MVSKLRQLQLDTELTPASTDTFYLDPEAVAATSDLDIHVRDTESFVAAHDVLHHAGYETELNLKRRLPTDS